MTAPASAHQDPTVFAIVQNGRLTYEAIIFCASFRAANPDFNGDLILAEPASGPLWPKPPGISDPAARALLEYELGAEIRPFDNQLFGARYPQGNKIEALSVLPEKTPFVFFDTDTLFLGPLADVAFDFARPTASMKRTNTWPKPALYGPGYTQIWKSLYDRFALDFESSLDLSFPDEYWERYLYFNAGWFFGACPRAFGTLFADMAAQIETDPPAELTTQALTPWLDQIALPLAIHAQGGGRDGRYGGLLDGRITCHYRYLPLLYAREDDRVVDVLENVTAPNRIKKVLKTSEAARRMIYQGKGRQVRALFDQSNLPNREEAIRNRLKREKLWLR
ncbi:MAG: hypothetical protein AAGA38_12800 [Pseudomonadota bacterium]